MKEAVRLLKVLADENRLRLLLLLRKKELFVCQIMAVSGLSQPLVSRNLALLDREGLLASRRSGKKVFYSLKKDLPPLAAALVKAVALSVSGESIFSRDRETLELFCRRFLRGAACDMTTVNAFIAFKNKKKIKGVNNGKTGQKSVH